jgi:outer membrane cobalamin receptor
MRLFLLALLLQSAAPNPQTIVGMVTDSQGNIIPRAVVRLEIDGKVVDKTETGDDGRFAFTTTATGTVRLVAIAPGFAEAAMTAANDASSNVVIAMQPAPFFEAVQVTSSRSDVAQVDATVVAAVYPASALIESGPLSLDDALKMVPGFTLFPSSRVANPTTQTVTLRGLGGSGVNRSLVLADGVPLNDSFGGWVHWDKVPHAAIDRVEVLRGGGSDLYGADAVGGVVQILTLQPGRPMMRALVEAGNLDTKRASLFAGGRVKRWSPGAAGEWFSTDGYLLPIDAEQGLIDRPAGSEHRSMIGWISYQAASWRIGLRADVYSEDRQNGTVLQANDTQSRQGSVNAAGSVGDGYLIAHVFGGTQGYDQTFSEIGDEPPRASEQINRIQRIPTSVVGGSLQWTRPWGRHTLLVGAEGRSIDGRTQETRFAHGDVLETFEAGGTASLGSAFARASLVVNNRLAITVGAHADAWQSSSQSSAFSQTIGSFSPRLSVAYRAGDSGMTVRGSVYGGFRAPTLNELHRTTQVGNDVTLANEMLTPERLRAGDAGVVYSRGRASARITGFWSVLDDTITNVTIATSPTLNVRQRQNADKMRSAGVEFEADVRLPRSLSVAVTSALIDSRFVGQTRLRDFYVPQVARSSVGVELRYNDSGWTVSGQFRATGPQFEDDVNTRKLQRAVLVDVFGGRTVARGTLLFVAVENLLDNEYDISRTPFRALGLPRAVRAGAQLTIP